ncbi:MAG: xanthine dehydrogenase family protein molybdopterin-binding subunit [Betaproteobacteria bacterium]|nr:xanthine dehydrogenase family protein molybdopterin-binding subunit [Betaproteobacteria bacterium]
MFSGKSIKRREDVRFLIGKGRYVDDMVLPNETSLAMLRSPHAHARIANLSITNARRMPGVLKILTAKDWDDAGLGVLPCMTPVRSRDGRPMNEVLRPVLAGNHVRQVGEGIAAVIAETREQAIDATEAIDIEFEPLPTVVSAAKALEEGAPILHERLGTNLVYDVVGGDDQAIEAAFARAAHVTKLEINVNRVTGCPMEPRTYLGHYDMADDRYTLWASTQVPHITRRWLAEDSLFVPEHKLRVVAPDVGGGFGIKVYHYPEQPLVLWASKLIGRPVRWTSTRSESLATDTHARAHITRCRMALDSDGKIIGVDVDTIANIGAYLSGWGPIVPVGPYTHILPQLYTIPLIRYRVRAAYTNTGSVDVYRGSGRPEATFVVERLLENAAREIGMDVCELRKRNFIQQEQFPYTTPTGLVYESGNPPGLLAKIEEMSEYEKLRSQQLQLRQEGVLMGIGVAVFPDIAGTGPSKADAKSGRKLGGYESALVRIHPSGRVLVLSGSHSHGQGHVTTYSQIAADYLGCDMDDIEVIEGDTQIVPMGIGTWGARSVSVGGMAIAVACKRVVEKGKILAAHLLECDAADIQFKDGAYMIGGTDRKISFREIAHHSYLGSNYPDGFELGWEATAFYDPLAKNHPSGAHLCVVIIDPATCEVKLRDYFAVDDCGRLINPMIVEGQVHGGLAQGIGQALFEDCSYDDENGQLLSGSFMDYCIPRASDLPSFRTAFQESLNPHNELGVKGGSESGTIGSPAAIGNAVVDALWHLGVRHVDLPITRNRIWQTLKAHNGQTS